MPECCKFKNNALIFFRRFFTKISFTNSLSSNNISINIPSTHFFKHTHHMFKNILTSFFHLTCTPSILNLMPLLYCLSSSRHFESVHWLASMMLFVTEPYIALMFSVRSAHTSWATDLIMSHVSRPPSCLIRII